MSEASEITAAQLLDRLKKAAVDLKQARDDLRGLRAAANEPIAIVGMGCRFGGGIDSPTDLWEAACAGEETVENFPTDRGWPEFDSASRRGSFLRDAAGFDAGFFGIGGYEATAMDPQQRHALEIAWEAIEDARIDPRSLRGSRTAVYLGATSFGYGGDYLGAGDGLAGHLVTGNVTSVLSGRISYLLGLTGPAVTLDTACSSALYAVHLAMAALRSRESDLALAGGITVMSTPGVFAEFTRQGGLAADGRCKSFSATADGTGWGEGAGVVVLQRLSDAMAQGRRVHAVIRAGAVNQDGASNGMTAPSGAAQRAVITAALHAAGLAAEDVDAVEAHGTGTVLGDPIEASAVLGTYGQGRPPGRPLWLGSIKPNIGHTQAAAGAGSLIKAAFMVGTGVLPPSLHSGTPSGVVDWSSGAVELLTREQRFPDAGRERRVGVSGFGISGTNVHLIVEQAPGDPIGDAGVQAVPRAIVPVVYSGRTTAAARRAAQALAARLSEAAGAEGAGLLRDLAFSQITTRAHHEERAVVLADSAPAAVAALRTPPATVRALAEPRPVFLFPGQGAQWAGMGTDLLEGSPIFAERFAQCAAALAEYTDHSPYEGLRAAATVDTVQPTLFAMMVSLAHLWAAHGVRPTALIGHSQGEIAAAVVAGALSLDDGARIVAVRSRALVPACGNGGMAAIAAAPGVVEDLLASRHWDIDIAGRNGPTSTVVSGPSDQLERLRSELLARDIRCWIIDVDYASHGRQMDQLRERLRRDIGPVTARSTATPFFSTVTGTEIDTARMDSDYWFANLRNPVLLQDAVTAAHDRGHRAFVEISPHPVLNIALLSTLEQCASTPTAVLATLRRDQGSSDDFLRSLADAYCAGLPVDFAGYLAGGRPTDVPHYPFEHRRYWYTPPRRTGGEGGDDIGGAATLDLPEPDDSGSESSDHEAAAFAAEIRSLGAARGRRAVVAVVLEALASALGADAASDLAADRSFLDLGVGSLAAVALRTALSARTGLALSTTIAFEFPTPAALAEHVHSRLTGEADAPAAGTESSATEQTGASRSQDAAILAELAQLTEVDDDDIFAALDRELG
ncbi:Acyl transferase OS=Tsukamurella paurometabola (strain ATCC 8368 / DSM / CCUG 35730 / CIP 100753/ JCM 10117 / KCTC 9821 / NBRC 16120 / NCIMB 702349 / NCTC 13040) OX=521096 GN=Tpau_3479 PE=4 SV=1 [Tsukamurella paurometabola]|uniref:Acyl transferase n=1 Tax=Tsukamurella paurometabola (strain ATCC 8368 / DSM 20162 / CCUG 35730 / CIP 100753 / JCM 10117 / KCTC 9821 / NBRC 16120 / NCIMB 702349 / NCTC 13040) TaxID=521096 RepID=D5UX41_TSUPD|nr:type I polyketide synthase [Tsukamurella paurometabola]ADG80060.1 Acyl transferase [Tsukamurella paurometabola DSM 20162]SUP38250.1 Erythronolide synthase, modules 5 and 6 [Tsukamurella paurometabola]